MQVSQGSGVCAALCIRQTLCRHVTIGTPVVIFLLFDCLLAVFDEWYTVPIVKNTQNHWCTNCHRSTKTVQTAYQRCINRQKQSKTVKRQSKQQKWPLVYQSPQVYQDCTNSVPIAENSQKQSKHSQNSTKMTIAVPVVTCLPRLYQPCTNSVPKTVKIQSKQQKMTIGAPVITGLPRLFQQCNNSLLIVNKNLAIANRARVSCAHNTSRAFIGLNITRWPWNLD